MVTVPVGIDPLLPKTHPEVVKLPAIAPMLSTVMMSPGITPNRAD
jgi:hypothetical protein